MSKKNNNHLRIWATGLMCIFLTTHVKAADVGIPGSAQGGRLDERFEAPQNTGGATSAPLTIKEEDTAAPAGADQTMLTLNKVVVEGATVYQAGQLEPIWQKDIGQQVSLGEVYKLADQLTVKYRNDGYVLARAIVPPQRIENGVIHIRVLEGYVIKVDYDGDTRGNQAILDAYAIAIQNDRPLKSSTLEKYLLLINDLPGVNAGSIVQPSPTDVGAANLTIILDQKPFDAYATLDNRGSKYIGPFQDTIGGRFNSVFGEFDQSRVQLASVPGKERELQFLDAEETVPFGGFGTTATVGGTYAHSRPGYLLKPEDLESEDETLDFSVAQPVIRSRSENLNFVLDFGERNSRSDILIADDNLYYDKLRVFRLTTNYNTADNLFNLDGSNNVTFEVHQGVNVFGATQFDSIDKSRVDGDPDFTKITSEISRIQQLNDEFSVQLAATGQYAFEGLLSSEQFGLGGSQYDRAYDPSEFLGDSGYAAKAELRYSNSISTGPIHSYQLYTYYDEGQVWNRHPQPGDFPNGLTAQSVGIGVRTTFTDYASGYLEVAQPIAREVTTLQNKGSRAFFNIQVHY